MTMKAVLFGHRSSSKSHIIVITQARLSSPDLSDWAPTQEITGSGSACPSCAQAFRVWRLFWPAFLLGFRSTMHYFNSGLFLILLPLVIPYCPNVALPASFGHNQSLCLSSRIEKRNFLTSVHSKVSSEIQQQIKACFIPVAVSKKWSMLFFKVQNFLSWLNHPKSALLNFSLFRSSWF